MNAQTAKPDPRERAALRKLTDDQMRSYLTEGYVLLQTQLPAALHAHIRDRCAEIFQTSGNPGNDILELNPAVNLIFSEPAVRGALASILGDDCFMHPHRHCHQNVSGTPAQRNHKDSYEDDINVHHHRSRWAMAMYYPQRVTADMGPTGITPGSQYFREPESLEPLEEIGVTGEAGTVIVVHYDLWHRALRNDSGRDRYMLKFLFCRASEPTAPAWDNQEAEWKSPVGRAGDDLEPLWEAMWRWNRGESPRGRAAVSDREATLEHLVGGPESRRLRTVYSIAPDLCAGTDRLFDLWREEAEAAERKARERDHTNPCEHEMARALGSLGTEGLDTLTQALQAEDWRIRGAAADAVGDMGLAARTLAPELAALLEDPSAWVRRNAVEALGVLEDSSDLVVEALCRTLQDADYMVGHNAALALRKLGQPSEQAIDSLLQAAVHEEPDIYRRRNSLMALDAMMA